MLYDYQSLKLKYSKYSNIGQKISSEVKKGNLVRIKKGLYTDNLQVDAPVLSNVCYEPSYISFEYALSYYGLIPEHVNMLTSACFMKKNNKKYSVDNMTFEYRSIPNDVFPYGILFIKNQDGIRYKIASKEKALCDTLYSKYPVRTIDELKKLLFEDLRIDINEFINLDFTFINNIAPLYHSNTLITLKKYIGRLENDSIRTNS